MAAASLTQERAAERTVAHGKCWVRVSGCDRIKGGGQTHSEKEIDFRCACGRMKEFALRRPGYRAAFLLRQVPDGLIETGVASEGKSMM